MKVSILASLVLATSAFSLSDFETLHRDLQPSEDEAWRTIPWETSLLAAQARAAREGKPIFIWAMDGHPLGCT